MIEKFRYLRLVACSYPLKVPGIKRKKIYMNLGYFNYPAPINEPVLGYAPGSKEKEVLKKTLQELKSTRHDIPMFIDGKEVRTGKTKSIRPPHEIAHILGDFHAGDE